MVVVKKVGRRLDRTSWRHASGGVPERDKARQTRQAMRRVGRGQAPGTKSVSSVSSRGAPAGSPTTASSSSPLVRRSKVNHGSMIINLFKSAQYCSPQCNMRFRIPLSWAMNYTLMTGLSNLHQALLWRLEDCTYSESVRLVAVRRGSI